VSYYFYEPKVKSKTYYITLICILLIPFSSAFGFQATFAPRLSITGVYTDNLYLAPEDHPDADVDPTRRVEDDFITILGAGLTVQLLGKFSGAEISYDPSYATYDEFDLSNGWRHSAAFSGWIELSKNTRLDARDLFYYTDDPLNAGGDSTTRRGREPYLENTAGLGLTHQFGEADSINLDYEYSILENEDEDIEDNARSRPSIGLTYWFIPRQLGFETNVFYRRAEFEVSDGFDEWYGSARLIKRFTRHFEGFVQYEHTVMDFDGETENYQIYNPSIGINYSTDETSNLSLRVGYFLQDWEVNEEDEDRSGITVSGILDKSWTFSRGSIYLTGSSGYDNEAYFGAENVGFDVYYQAGCIASYGFTRHITGDIFGSYRIDNYVNIDPERDDKTARAGLGLTIQPLTWMSIELNYTYRSVDSTLDIDDYEENRGLIRIALYSSQPFRTSQ
jgi:hypothetical protein